MLRFPLTVQTFAFDFLDLCLPTGDYSRIKKGPSKYPHQEAICSYILLMEEILNMMFSIRQINMELDSICALFPMPCSARTDSRWGRWAWATENLACVISSLLSYVCDFVGGTQAPPPLEKGRWPAGWRPFRWLLRRRQGERIHELFKESISQHEGPRYGGTLSTGIGKLTLPTLILAHAGMIRRVGIAQGLMGVRDWKIQQKLARPEMERHDCGAHLHHLGCIKQCQHFIDIYHVNWCRISSINSTMPFC